MSSVLFIGIIVSLGFLCGEIARHIGLPKVTGFILAGVILNPGLFHFIPGDFTDSTDAVTNIALCFITFSVGGTLRFSRIKKLGKSIIAITLCEGEFAFVISVVGLLLVGPLVIGTGNSSWTSYFLPIALLMGCLASPTDPSATLAVAHEYKAKGVLTSTVLGITAFDDVLGIINYSIAVALAGSLVTSQNPSISAFILSPLYDIFGAVLLGIIFGLAFNLVTYLIRRETEGALIVIILASLSICFGVCRLVGVDELLSTMTMGLIVVNYNSRHVKIFNILERYTEELIFVLFFTLSGMHLNFSVLSQHLLLIFFFVLFRTIGKVAGATAGAMLSKAPGKVVRYVSGGLIPQGGIVIGLALIIKQNPAFADISDIIISVIIGATIIHELVGPVISRIAIKAAGEIPEP